MENSSVHRGGMFIFFSIFLTELLREFFVGISPGVLLEISQQVCIGNTSGVTSGTPSKISSKDAIPREILLQGFGYSCRNSSRALL